MVTFSNLTNIESNISFDGNAYGIEMAILQNTQNEFSGTRTGSLSCIDPDSNPKLDTNIRSDSPSSINIPTDQDDSTADYVPIEDKSIGGNAKSAHASPWQYSARAPLQPQLNPINLSPIPDPQPSISQPQNQLKIPELGMNGNGIANGNGGQTEIAIAQPPPININMNTYVHDSHGHRQSGSNLAVQSISHFNTSSSSK